MSSLAFDLNGGFVSFGGSARQGVGNGAVGLVETSFPSCTAGAIASAAGFGDNL